MRQPYFELGGVQLFHGDSREVLPELVAAGKRFSAIVTDPPWPGAKVKLPGSDRPVELFREVVAHAPKLADRLVVYLGRETDPRLLSVVPKELPYLCTSWLRFLVPRRAGVIVRGANVAYAFGKGERPRDARVIPGASWPGMFDEIEGCDANDGKRLSRSIHPCPMQYGHAYWLVRWLGGKSVLDPLAGSGTTLVAARDFGVPAVGVEVNEAFCEQAALRLAQRSIFEPAKVTVEITEPMFEGLA